MTRKTTDDRSGGRLWALLTLVTSVVAALVPLVHERRFYFFGDTQIGAFGQWYHLGQQLRAGHWPLFDPQVWAAGNFVAEGQWGLFSPLTALIGLLASATPNAVVFATLVKISLLVAGSLGTYALARSYRASPPAAFVAGVASALGGATLYLESPSWVTGQMTWALLPLFWWQLRRVAVPLPDRPERPGRPHGAVRWASPAAVLVLGWLIVSVGYVYGTLYIVLVGVATIIDCALARRWGGALRVVLVGVICGLLAVTVYLPGVLTAPVTTRLGFEIISDGRLQGTLSGVMTSMLPFTDRTQPTAYIAWFLPLLMWVRVDRLRPVLRDLVGLLLVLLVMLMWLLGPNQVGPIRWPMRVLPIVTLLVVLTVMIILSRAGASRPSVRRLVGALGVAFVAGYLTVSRSWDARSLIALGTALVLVGLAVTWTILRLRAPAGAEGAHRRTTAALAFVAVWGLVVLAVQLQAFPSPSSNDRHMPAAVSDYSRPASAAEGDTIVIGNIEKVLIADPAASRDFLMASSWYLSPHPVQSTYTTIGYETYTKRFCVLYSGNLCPRGLTALFETDPATGSVRADLLSVSSLQLLRKDFKATRLENPPAGWHVAYRSTYAVTWVRDRVLPPAGGVTWASDGVAVSQTSSDARSVTFTVDKVPSGGGRVVLSRLQWPGYTVSGASLVDPTDGYLVTVAVPAGSAGQQVTVSFSPPGWALELATLVAAAFLALAWIVVAALRRRRRSTRASGTGANDSPDEPASRSEDTGAPGNGSGPSDGSERSDREEQSATPAEPAESPQPSEPEPSVRAKL
ncbi:hypothetical protein [Terrabacter sp. C0L_2]|uniref:hypothetical protein n=1 Tax=Terrabacter sp. C0L_2 TaxID=3108389 RepID=UPI002ED3633B|nr:hypothetical protein U5C87_11565 [Terrabacter sp. C0L_2]